ncbi:DUF5707 domain-containing protein [Streptomyces sp. NPDC000983]|uniref:DUF5707 domain-containing protein n=1 Tax=Streptomyces sp. NPDC000983 TaxID=3154373 RepID=UPI00332FFF36
MAARERLSSDPRRIALSNLGCRRCTPAAGSGIDSTESELRYVDKAECRSTSDETSRCTYTLKVTRQESADLPVTVTTCGRAVGRRALVCPDTEAPCSAESPV